MTTFLRVIGILLLVVLISCKKNNPGITDPPNPPPPDTNWVARQQIDIPWPGLASSAWPTFLHDVQRTGRSPYRGPQEGKIEWYYQTSQQVFSSAALGSDGTIYIQGLDRNLYALMPTGALKWTFDIHYSSEALTTIGSDGTIYAGANQHGTLFALDENGNKKWEYSTGGSGHWRAPLVSRDGKTIFFLAGDTVASAISLFALTDDGAFRWKFTPSQRDLGYNSPALSPDGRVIYLPGQGGSEAAFYAVDTSGAMIWRFLAPGAGSTSSTSAPCVDNDGNIYFTCGITLYSLTPNGSIRWQAGNLRISNLGGSVIGSDGTIYLSGGGVYAFDWAGKKKWEFSPDSFTAASTPAVDREGTLYVGGYVNPPDTTDFYALNANGSVRWRMALRGANGLLADITSSPAVSADGRIYVGSDGQGGNRIYAIR